MIFSAETTTDIISKQNTSHQITDETLTVFVYFTRGGFEEDYFCLFHTQRIWEKAKLNELGMKEKEKKKKKEFLAAG